MSSTIDFLNYRIAWAAGFWEGEGSCGVYDKPELAYQALLSEVPKVSTL